MGTKTARTLLSSQSLAGAASVNASELNLSTAYGALVAVRLTNGGTAPTTAPNVKFYAGHATGIKHLFYTASGDTVNNSVIDLIADYPLGAMFVNITITNGATNAITVEAFAQEASTI